VSSPHGSTYRMLNNCTALVLTVSWNARLKPLQQPWADVSTKLIQDLGSWASCLPRLHRVTDVALNFRDVHIPKNHGEHLLIFRRVSSIENHIQGRSFIYISPTLCWKSIPRSPKVLSGLDVIYWRKTSETIVPFRLPWIMFESRRS